MGKSNRLVAFLKKQKAKQDNKFALKKQSKSNFFQEKKKSLAFAFTFKQKSKEKSKHKI